MWHVHMDKVIHTINNYRLMRQYVRTNTLKTAHHIHTFQREQLRYTANVSVTSGRMQRHIIEVYMSMESVSDDTQEHRD